MATRFFAILSAVVSIVGTSTASKFLALKRQESNSTAGPYGLDNILCERSFYAVEANSTNTKFVGFSQTNLTQPEITSLILQYSTSPNNFTEKYIDGTFEFSGTFNISGVLCSPITGSKADSAIQLLVHGVGFDLSYWDFEFAPEYSYVRHAGSYGYTTFLYDRLGTGQSETPDNGFDITQAPTEIAILRSFARMLRNTTIVGGKQWSKVVGIGHSYGAAQTQALSASNPELYDAIILQGYSVNGTYTPNAYQASGYSPAREVFPQTFADKPPTWVVTATPATNQMPFWLYPYYDPGAFTYARENEQAVTPGAFFTLAGTAEAAPGFNKPVQVILPDKDFIFAASDAYAGPNGVPLPVFVHTMLYPNASSFEYYIPANTGHAANTHYSAPQTYETMIDFISRQGL